MTRHADTGRHGPFPPGSHLDGKRWTDDFSISTRVGNGVSVRVSVSRVRFEQERIISPGCQDGVETHATGGLPSSGYDRVSPEVHRVRDPPSLRFVRRPVRWPLRRAHRFRARTGLRRGDDTDPR